MVWMGLVLAGSGDSDEIDGAYFVAAFYLLGETTKVVGDGGEFASPYLGLYSSFEGLV